MLSERIEFRPEADTEVFSAVAAAPAVFLLRGEDANSEPYVSKTTTFDGGCSGYFPLQKRERSALTYAIASVGSSTR